MFEGLFFGTFQDIWIYEKRPYRLRNFDKLFSKFQGEPFWEICLVFSVFT